MGYECSKKSKSICRTKYFKKLFLKLIKTAKMLPVESSLRSTLRRLIFNLFSFKSCGFLLQLRARLASENYKNCPKLKSLIDRLYLMMADKQISDRSGISNQNAELRQFAKELRFQGGHIALPPFMRFIRPIRRNRPEPEVTPNPAIPELAMPEVLFL